MNTLSNITTMGENLIFIVGSPRSGTTYLRRLLESFPGIHSGEESHLFEHVGPFVDLWHGYAQSQADPNYYAVGLPVYFTEEEFITIARKLVSELMKPMLANLTPGELFLEKTPSHALYLHTIQELLPKARIIHILRDSRDVVASLLAKSREKQAWAPSQADQCAQVWIEYVEHVNRIASSYPPEAFLEVRYESLVDSPQVVLKTIANFLDRDWSGEEIQTAITQNSIESTRAQFGQQHVRRGGSGYWQQDLTRWEKFRVWQVARNTMSKVGYEWRFPW